ncbi:HEAT repeat domain-containing protein [Promicromonospora sukumoe]|uniref:HEAT repeat domain-containing protein n=1 Tax=Promicromonospora sukumoe TaxID=88382 RepID=UPI0037CB5A3B
MSQQTTSPSAEVAAVLAAVEAFDWTTVSHAYGDATDLPEMLRALALDEDTGPDSAAGDLWGSICHQGTVYSASAAAVPFLAGLAVAGAAPMECFWLLGAMAESEDTAPGAEEDVRNAVRAEVDRLLSFATHPDAEVRQAAVHAFGQARTADVLPTLRAVLERDSTPVVRAEALIALVRCDAPEQAALIAAAYDDVATEVRLASVFAAFDAGLPWDDRVQQVLLSVDGLDDIGSSLHDGHRHEPLSWVVGELCDAGHGAAAAGLVLEAADRADGDISAVLWAATQACEASRVATELLRPLAEKHVDSAEGRWLAETIGSRADSTPAPRPLVLTFDQPLLPGAAPDLGIEELRERAATALPDDGLTTPDIDRKLMVAATLWERTADPAPMVGAVSEAAERLSGRESFIWGYERASAARTAARLGPAAAPLEAALRTFLADPIALAASATALVRAGCELDADDVAMRLAAQAGEYRDEDTVTALATLAPLLSPASVQRWREVIDQDERLVGRGVQKSAVAADEQFRADLLAALGSAARR